ncbi:hypothetical protein [Lichenicoccus sp.]|uniref:hypothetical protein n=1 Tax=Lichenicoccus sp. TaxID=2781899 RepID=UPI003D0E057E
MTTLRAAASRLTDILELENQALRQLDLPAATSLLAAKRAALASFELIQARHPAPAPSDQTIWEDLRRLRATTAENKTLLERAMRAQQHIMALLARAAQRTGQADRYGAKGGYAGYTAVHSFALSARA